ncbi:MAG: hypothetical protein JWN78_3345 [Bacteroidota bacterium]|nr:hypothetical protein [Bacteroidota bacterium]
MRNKALILFFKIFILSIPVLILLASYIYYDPIRVVHRYSNYMDSCFIALDRDFFSSEVYITKRQKYHYNAFILGNSRSLAFLCKDWKPYIDSSVPFHYDASKESLVALRDKIKFIDKKKDKINYALIVLDHGLLENMAYGEGPLFIPHPSVSNVSWVSFHLTFFEAYLSNFYFVKYIDYYNHGKYKPYMRMIIERKRFAYDPISNDLYLKIFDDEAERDPVNYIKRHFGMDSGRDTSKIIIEKPVVEKEQVRCLNEIKNIFDKQHTNYKIVISPLYDQKYLNKKDLKKLNEIFGKENVYDFSGKNEYTRHVENYYEISHYRPKVARDIMKKIYGDKTTSGSGNK